MRYPTLTVQTTQAAVARLLSGEPIDAAADVHWMGRGDDIDLVATERCAATIIAELHEFGRRDYARDLDRFEGRAAGHLHAALVALPVEALDDPGFWRFLTVQFFWELVHWREPRAFDSGDYGRYRQYVDGTNPAECVLLRMFVRGRLVEDRGTYELGEAIPFGADFWRSHILRVKTAGSPRLARALARSHAQDRMATDELREVASRLNRLWTNVVLYTYDDQEAAELVSELRSQSFEG